VFLFATDLIRFASMDIVFCGSAALMCGESLTHRSAVSHFLSGLRPKLAAQPQSGQEAYDGKAQPFLRTSKRQSRLEGKD
jgi:hypothetical protein